MRIERNVHPLRAAVRNRPGLKRRLVDLRDYAGAVRHALGRRVPGTIRARTRKLTVAVTAHCNLRCVGCRYGRDFMPGSQMPLQMALDLLEDGRAAGVDTVRLYGGEPLLHPDLPAMVRRAVDLGYQTYLTTNGITLGQHVDALVEAGLRSITVGFYGTGAHYDTYVQRKERFERLEDSLRQVRERHGDRVSMQLNYLVMRPSCSLEALGAAWEFAERFGMTFHTDLIHYSLPYFTEGPERELQFRPEDADAIRTVTDALCRLKVAHPERIPESLASLRSIPDWLLRGSEMRVPCDVYKMLWIGADGTVQLCYVTFPLGNLHERRLRDILNTSEHHQAARDAFALKCPNCHCERDARVLKDFASRRTYGAAGA